MALSRKSFPRRFFPTALTVITWSAVTLPGCDSEPETSPDSQASTKKTNQLPIRQIAVDLTDLIEELEQIPGIADIEELESETPEYRAIAFSIEQPVFHHAKSGETFKQHVELLYKGPLAPNVLIAHAGPMNFETMPGIPPRPKYPERFTQRMSANEVSVEPRFCGTSTPNSGDYSALTLDESAADLHRVLEKLKPLFAGNWISTGRQEAGTLAIHHRRQYPFDTHATVAFAPQVHLGLEDPRYGPFFSQVGSKACRDKLLAFQIGLLESREEIIEGLTSMLEEASGPKLEFDKWPGGLDQAYDHFVHHIPAWFWRTSAREHSPNDCEYDPESQGIFKKPFFLAQLMSLAMQSDFALEATLPHSLHTRTELGSPRWDVPELESLYKHDVHDFSPFLLGNSADEYDPNRMLDLSFWTSVSMNRLIMIHGEFDPASTTKIPLATPRIGEAYSFVAPQSGFYPSIADLNSTDQTAAVDALTRWTGATWVPDDVDPPKVVDLHGQIFVDERLIDFIQDVLDRRRQFNGAESPGSAKLPPRDPEATTGSVE